MEEEESKVVVDPKITFAEYRAHMEACLDKMESAIEDPEGKADLTEWEETLIAISDLAD